MTAIELKKVSKKFNLVHEKERALLNISEKEDFYALKNVNLKVRKGECLGVIGPNGSGKTTLLKIIAGILEPTKGTVKVNGKILTFLDTGAGFREELTGKENIFLYGSILGMGHSEIKRNFNRIVEFAQLEKFINVKLKDYSTGMRLRLAVATAMVNNPDIILIDEILAVGDEEFQKKSLNRIRLMKEQGKTMVLVSHDMPVIRDICERAVFLENGEIRSYGLTNETVSHYLKYTRETEKEKLYSYLVKKLKLYNETETEIKKLKSNKGTELPLISQLLDRRTKSKIRTIEKKQENIKGELLDLVDDIIEDSAVFITNFWDKKRERKDSKKVMKQIKLIKLALKIKMDLFGKKTSIRNTDILKSLISIKKIAIKDNNTQIKEIMSDFKEILLSNVDTEYKKRTLQELRFFVSSLNADENDSDTIEYIFMEYDSLISKLPFISEDERSFLRRDIYKFIEEIIHHLNLKSSKKANKKITALKKVRKSLVSKLNKNKIKKKEQSDKVEITDVIFLDKNNSRKNTLYTNKQLKITIDYNAKGRIENPVFGIAIHRDDGIRISAQNTKFHDIKIPYIKGKGSISYIIDKLPLLEGTYFITVAVHPYDSLKPYDLHEREYSFRIKKRKKNNNLGIIHLESRWEINK